MRRCSLIGFTKMFTYLNRLGIKENQILFTSE